MDSSEDNYGEPDSEPGETNPIAAAPVVDPSDIRYLCNTKAACAGDR